MIWIGGQTEQGEASEGGGGAGVDDDKWIGLNKHHPQALNFAVVSVQNANKLETLFPILILDVNCATIVLGLIAFNLT